MFFRRLLVVLGSLGIIATLAAPAAAATTSPTPKIIEGIFDISRLTVDQQLLVEEALACDDFDWARLKPSLKKKTGRSAIVVENKDLSKWGAVGASWSTGVLQMEKTITDPHWYQQIFMHEIGHMVDFYYLMPRKLHDEVSEIYGAPWSVMGHDFNGGFTNAFSCFDAGDANGYLDEIKILQIRTLLGGVASPPAKTL